METLNDLWDLWVEEEQLCKANKLVDESIKRRKEMEEYQKQMVEFNALFGSTETKKENQND